MANADNTARSKSLFGSYDIVETVGQGGMGVVYRAHDTALDRVVALKVLKEDLRTHASVVERFRREGEAFASLNHPNIVHIYSVGSVGSIPYIAMEYIEGEPLSRRMKREKRMDWQDALAIAQQVAEALGCAHDAHIIHRDIKPANVLIAKDNHAYVTDFGIAKILTAETSLTVDGTRLGTPQYMSPERCENREVSPASDIYSLGVFIFLLISGSLPYEADTPISLVREITTDPPKRISDLVPSIPKDVERLVAYMIEKDPKNRPVSAQEAAILIGRVREGKPLEINNSGMRQAIEDFRDGMATPTPTSTSHFDSAAWEEGRAFLQKLRDGWVAVPGSVKFFFLAVAVAGVCGVIGIQIAAWMNRGYAINEVAQAVGGVDRWQQPARVAEFADEAPGVIVGRALLPGFDSRGLRWIGADAALVSLTGRANSPRANEGAVVLLSPDSRTGILALGPSPSQFSVVGTPLRAPLHRRGFYFQSTSNPGELRFWSATDNTESVIIGSGDPLLERGARPTFGPLSVHPLTSGIVVSVAGIGPAETWTLVQREVDAVTQAVKYVELTHPGLAIESVMHSGDGSVVAYVEKSSETGNELWVANTGVAANERIIASGNFRMSAGAFEPKGPRLALVSRTPENVNTIQVYDTSLGSLTAELGAGNSVEWSPSGDVVVTVDADRKGHLQVWSVWLEPPHERKQLTFIDGGTSELCAVSPDGRWVVSTLAAMNPEEQPEFVFVELAPVAPALDEATTSETTANETTSGDEISKAEESPADEATGAVKPGAESAVDAPPTADPILQQ